MKYIFRIKDIINNYRHCIIIPDKDYEGRKVESKEKIMQKIKRGEYEFIFLF